MSALSRSTLMSILLTATPVLAAAEDRGQPDNLVVWMFLGLCALIIVAQIIPLARNARRHAKAAAEQSKVQEQTQSN